MSLKADTVGLPVPIPQGLIKTRSVETYPILPCLWKSFSHQHVPFSLSSCGSPTSRLCTLHLFLLSLFPNLLVNIQKQTDLGQAFLWMCFSSCIPTHKRQQLSTTTKLWPLKAQCLVSKQRFFYLLDICEYPRAKWPHRNVLKNYSLRRNQLIEQEVKTYPHGFSRPSGYLLPHLAFKALLTLLPLQSFSTTAPSRALYCLLSNFVVVFIHAGNALFLTCLNVFHPLCKLLFIPSKTFPYHLDLLPFFEFRRLLICMVYFPNVIYLIMTLFCLIIDFSYI